MKHIDILNSTTNKFKYFELDGFDEYDFVHIDLINDNIYRHRTRFIIEHLYEYAIEYDSTNCITIKLSYIKKHCPSDDKRRYDINYKCSVCDTLKANCSLERIGHITFKRLMNGLKELYNISIYGEYKEAFKEMFIKDFVKILLNQ